MESVRFVRYFGPNAEAIQMHQSTHTVPLLFLALIVHTRSNRTGSVKAQIALISNDNTQSYEAALLSFSLSLDVSQDACRAGALKDNWQVQASLIPPLDLDCH